MAGGRRRAGSLLCALALALPGCSRPKPNVVLIVVDTLRRDHLPFYGYDKPTAPFLSSLAERGALFENAYSTSAWTAPATASLFTGLYPVQHGVVMGRFAVKQLRKGGVPMRLNRIPRQAETIPKALKAGGYATFAVVENSNIRPELGFDQGFDAFHPLNPAQEADAITAKLRELQPVIAVRRPYFLYLHYMDPHEPYARNRPFFDRRARGDARQVSAFDSEIHHVDDHIRQAFELFGWDRDTVVLLTADHGEELGDRGFWGHARTLYGETLNVPLLAFGARIAPRRIAARVSHVDLLPTLAEAAGTTAPSGLAGQSLWPLVRGKASALPERVLLADFWHAPDGRPRPQIQVAIRGPWKRLDGEPGGPYLFNLDLDPRESVNRIGVAPQIARELLEARQRFEAQARRYEPEYEETIQDEKTNEELRALGYVN
jgi:arylsulfatase A-like enzyme